MKKYTGHEKSFIIQLTATNLERIKFSILLNNPCTQTANRIFQFFVSL